MDPGLNVISWAGLMPAQSALLNQSLCILLLSYVLGCFTAGYYLVRLRTGQDIRQLGSGSVGARNVGRLLGKGGFILTMLTDLTKGALAVWIAIRFTTDARLAALALVAVVVGHIWPAQLRFHGGKGAATSLGALMVFDWSLCVVFVCVFIVLWLVVRRMLAPGLVAFALLPLASGWMSRDHWDTAGISILAVLVLVAHRKNIVDEIMHWIARRSVQPKPDQPFE